jgi:hypothetical protein
MDQRKPYFKCIDIYKQYFYGFRGDICKAAVALLERAFFDCASVLYYDAYERTHSHSLRMRGKTLDSRILNI